MGLNESEEQLLSKVTTNGGQCENSSYFDGWKAYDRDPYHPTQNPEGVIQMGLAENLAPSGPIPYATAYKSVEEHISGRDAEGRSDYAPGRLKGGITPANGQGKPKKGGRISLREGKRIRPSNEQEIEDEDDIDLSLR